jgi:hypothetical protein
VKEGEEAMNRVRFAMRHGSVLGLLLLASGPGSAAHALTHAEVAARWAPIHYQDTDASDYFSDLLSRVDYDGDLISTNNWDNLHAGDYVLPEHCFEVGDPPVVVCPRFHDAHLHALTGAAYYSVVETCTHWFVIYAFFHPRDWDDGTFDHEHENDFEDLLVIVRKGEGWGTLEGLAAQAHRHYFSYVPAGSPLTPGEEDIDGVLPMGEYPPGSGLLRPETAQEAKGHGAGAKGAVGNFAGEPDRDGVIYVPSGIAEEPASGNHRGAGYELVSFFEPDGLWERQLIEDGAASRETYHSWGTLWGDKSGTCGSGVTLICGENSAKTPWAQDDEDDSPARGETALDPVSFVQDYFDGLGDFDHFYVENRYLQDMAALGYGPGNEPDGYSGPALDAALFAKLAPADFDGDGLHRCDERALGTDPTVPDSDGDGTNDGDDAFPSDPGESLDSDGDGIGDQTDADDDGDGIPDVDDAFPLDPTESADADDDGIGDNADTDDDDDGLPDVLDASPYDPDEDDDGLVDGQDVEFVQRAVAALPADSIRPPGGGTLTAMLSILDEIEALLLGSERNGAIRKLINLRRRLDGCEESPDPNDWLVTCAAQQEVRFLVDLLLDNV